MTPPGRDSPSGGRGQGGVPTPAFQTHQVKQHVNEAMAKLTEVVSNMHLDMLKQFHMQQTDLMDLAQHFNERIDSMSAELGSLRNELSAYKNKEQQMSNWV